MANQKMIDLQKYHQNKQIINEFLNEGHFLFNMMLIIS